MIYSWIWIQNNVWTPFNPKSCYIEILQTNHTKKKEIKNHRTSERQKQKKVKMSGNNGTNCKRESAEGLWNLFLTLVDLAANMHTHLSHNRSVCHSHLHMITPSFSQTHPSWPLQDREGTEIGNLWWLTALPSVGQEHSLPLSLEEGWRSFWTAWFLVCTGICQTHIFWQLRLILQKLNSEDQSKLMHTQLNTNNFSYWTRSFTAK